MNHTVQTELLNFFVWRCLLRFDSSQCRGRQEMTGERAKDAYDMREKVTVVC